MGEGGGEVWIKLYKNCGVSIVHIAITWRIQKKLPETAKGNSMSNHQQKKIFNPVLPN